MASQRLRSALVLLAALAVPALAHVYESRARHASLAIAPVVERERKGVAVSLGL